MAGEPFSYINSDCASFVVGWADEVRNVSSLAEWNSFYRDEAGCLDFVRSQGGFAMIADRFLTRHHAAVCCKNLKTGNIVLVDFGGVETMGIRTSDVMIALRSKGVHLTRRARAIAEWCLPCPR